MCSRPRSRYRTNGGSVATAATIVRRTVRRLAAALLVLPWLGVALAQSPPQPTGPIDAFTEQMALWDETLQAIGTRLDESRVTRGEIDMLNDRLRVLQELIVESRDRAAARAEAERELLDTLGPPPDEGEVPESDAVAAEREEIRQDLSFYQSQQKQSELLLVRLNGVLEQMVSAQYATLFGLLSSQTVFPLAPSTLAEARLQLGERLGEIASRIVDWWGSAPGTHLSPAIGLPLVLVAGWLAQRTLRVWRRGRQERAPSERTPNRGQRFGMAIVYIGERGIIPAGTLLALAAILRWQPLIGTQVQLKASGLLLVAAQLIFILGVVAAVLAPRDPRWRITGFTDDAARGLYAAVRLYVLVTLTMASVIVMLHPTAEVTANISEEALASYFRIYPELSSGSGMLILVVSAATLLNILRPRHWRFVRERSETASETATPDTEDDEDYDDDRFRGRRTSEQQPAADTRVDDESAVPDDAVGHNPTPLSRIGLTLGRVALMGSLVAGAFGFLNAGVYIADRMASTVGLIGLALMLRNLIAVGLHHATAADSRLGKHLRTRLVLDDTNTSRLMFWLLLVIDTLLIAGVIVALLLLWGLPLAELQLLSDLVFYGVAFGDLTLSVTDALIAVAVFLLVLTVVRILRGILSAKILTQTRLDIGARDAVTTIAGYLGLTVAVLVALMMLGIDLSRLALILGALSIGIGFGLQHLVSNFVSGLILLATRPIKSGDWIVVGQHQGYVKHISVITTEIQTFDNAAVLVPNSSLVSSEVLNWTHKSTVGRVIVAVRAGYDASPEQVRKVLRGCVKENRDVLRRPAPLVLFMGFGASSLDFEIRFFIREIDNVLLVSSDMRYQIVEAFHEAGISIPFPQQDIHLRDARTVSDDGEIASADAPGQPGASGDAARAAPAGRGRAARFDRGG